MEKDFDFNRIGKRMPYRIPEGSLDEMEANIWNEVQDGLPQIHKRKRYRLRIFVGCSCKRSFAVCVQSCFPQRANR